jgi:hypothetical protein
MTAENTNPYEEDLECLNEIEHTLLENGEHRYMVYDALEDQWCVVAHGHAPAHLMPWSFVPAKFASMRHETLYLAKRYVIEHARGVIKRLADKAQWW